MKVDFKAAAKCSREGWWKTLVQFENYHEWNPIISSLEGGPELDSKLNATLQIVGQSKKKASLSVTGSVPYKYLSIVKQESLGSWWGQTEFVFRHEETPEGEFQVICEIYCHGLFLRFRKASVRAQLERTVKKLGERLVEQL